MRRKGIGLMLSWVFALLALGGCKTRSSVSGSWGRWAGFPAMNIDSLFLANPDSVDQLVTFYEGLLFPPAGLEDFKKEVLAVKLEHYKQQQSSDSIMIVLQELTALHLNNSDTLSLLPLLKEIDYNILSHKATQTILEPLQIVYQYLENHDIQTGDAIGIRQILASGLIEINDFDAAKSVLEQTLQISFEIDEHQNRVTIYELLGQMYLKQELFAGAKNNFKKAYELAKGVESLAPFYPQLLINLGLVYKKSGQLDSAIYYYEQSLAFTPEKDVIIRLQNTLNLGNVYMAKGDFDRAMILYNRVKTECVEKGITQGVLYAEINIGDLLYRRGWHQKSIDHLQQILANKQVLLAALRPESLYAINQILENAYQQTGQYQAAYTLRKAADLYQDSIQTAENKRIIEDLSRAFEVELLSLEHRILSTRKKRGELWIRSFILVIVILGIVAGLVVYNYIRRKRFVTKYQIALRETEEALKLKQLVTAEKEALHQQLLTQEHLRTQQLEEQIELLRAEVAARGVDITVKNQEEFWIEFALRFKLIFPHFEQSLLDKYPNLSVVDIHFCKLTKLKLPGNEIANILHIELRSLYNKKQRILEKMGVPPEARNSKLADFFPDQTSP